MEGEEVNQLTKEVLQLTRERDKLESPWWHQGNGRSAGYAVRDRYDKNNRR